MPQINIADIFIDETFNSRDEITPFDVSDLMKSIADNGLLQPIIVSPWDKDGLKWRLVAGFRRTFACRFSEWVEIEAVIKEVKNEDEAIRLNLTENHVRSNLNILEEAKAIKRFKDRGMTQMATSNLLGKKNFSRGWVQVRFKLLELPPEIQQAAASGWLTGDDIKSLDGYTKEELFEQVKLLKESRQKAALGKGIRRKISKTSSSPSPPRPSWLRNRKWIWKIAKPFKKGSSCLMKSAAPIVTPWAVGMLMTIPRRI